MKTEIIKQQHEEMKELIIRINDTLNQIKINQEQTLNNITNKIIL